MHTRLSSMKQQNIKENFVLKFGCIVDLRRHRAAIDSVLTLLSIHHIQFYFYPFTLSSIFFQIQHQIQIFQFHICKDFKTIFFIILGIAFIKDQCLWTFPNPRMRQKEMFK